MPKLQVFPLALLGGLSDSKAIPEPGDLQELTNMVPFRGRFALRAPLSTYAQLYSDDTDEPPSGAAVDKVLAIAYHNGFMWVLAWRGGSIKKVYLYKLSIGSPYGSPVQPEVGLNWNNVAAAPRVSMVGFQGGSATGTVDRLYISDIDQSYNSCYYVPGTGVTEFAVDLDDEGNNETVKFSLMFPYQHHLWGTGYYQNNSSARPEMARFSRPGLIAEDEPDSNAATQTREWWSVDHREFGRRGEPIVAVGFAGESAIIFKSGDTHALFGYDADSWARKTLSPTMGAVGPYAVASTDIGRCFAWSARGPVVTDGSDFEFIGEDILYHLQQFGGSNRTAAGYSPDDGLVYFLVKPDGTTGAPTAFYVFDAETKKFAYGGWLVGSNNVAQVTMLAPVQDLTLPGPVGPPTGGGANAVSANEIDVTWTNGDTSLGVQTEVHRGTSSGFSPDGTNLIHTAQSGVAGYNDTACPASQTPYYYKFGHLKNSQYNNNATAITATTWLLPQTSPDAASTANGIRVYGHNPETGADAHVYRKPESGTYADIHTVTNPGVADWNWEDTDVTKGAVYYYYFVTVKAGQHNSVDSDAVMAVAGQPTPAITGCSHDATVGVECPSSPNVTISWGGTNLESSDIVKVYRNVNRSSYVEVAQISATAYGATDYFLRKSGGTTQYLQYKLELYEGGTTLVDTDYTTESSHQVNTTPCEPI